MNLLSKLLLLWAFCHLGFLGSVALSRFGKMVDCKKMPGFTDWRLAMVVLVLILMVVSANAVLVDLTLVKDAVAKGAVCLDGSQPGYHLSRGFGSGVNHWLVHFEGGSWCNNITTCSARAKTPLGSSKYMVKQLDFLGILGNNRARNPDFYNWNRIKVRYCDGASFTGDVEAVNPVDKLYFRGKRVFKAVIDDLKEKGMINAKQAVISGCSAGGLTSIFHCDNFRALMPKTTKAKCLADAGFFIDVKDVSGAYRIRSFFTEVATLQQSVKNLPLACTKKLGTKCFFPQYLLPYIQTPLFLLNAGYDSWQIRKIVAPGVADPHGRWHNCKLDIKKCSSSQLETIQRFRIEMLNALRVLQNSASGGMFINSCYAHCQSEMQETWHANDSPRLNGLSIAEAVGNWYSGQGVVKKTDCPYPCDSTCPKT